MRKIFLIVGAAFVALCPAATAWAGTLETSWTQADASFKAVPLSSLSFKPARYVGVSAQLALNGSGFISRPPGYVTITLRGQTDIQDSSGRIRSGFLSVSENAYVYVSGGMVSHWVRLNTYVSFYQDGRHVGSAWVSGNIPVSGYLSGNWLSLSGSGALSGNLSISD
ncbi:MAG: hypothetical protein A3J74_08540 [Elusimicrobia bacterium RIFCSPHIGHO2_02_FULL_57_9]|nr:MAG: hypothetical protein A3J74_08540 [Elusimicrobia bacterium RIFCSPHIGHO2_02_FULL_57_9]